MLLQRTELVVRRFIMTRRAGAEARLYSDRTAQDHPWSEATHEGRRQDLRIWGIEGQRVVYNTSPGPHVGAPLCVRAPLRHIKWRARTIDRQADEVTSLRSSHILPLGLREHTLSSGNTTHSGRRVLRSGGPNHSKSLCASRIHSPLDRALLDCPQAHPTLRIRRV